MSLNKKDQRIRRSRQTRARIAKQNVARLTVFRTNLHIYANVISDDGAKVLASASTAEADVRKELGGAGKGGNVINLTSIDALHPNGMASHYNASKAGVLMLTKALALELAPHKIRVNSVAPGGIKTPGTDAVREELRKTMGLDPDDLVSGWLQRVPLGRMGEPDDIAKVVLFLASAASEYMTGENILVDGGYLLS